MNPRTPVRRLIAAAAMIAALVALVPLATPVTAGQSNDAGTGATLQVCATCEFTDIQGAVTAATAGDRIEVNGGSYDGPLVIDKPLTLIGVDEPVIDGHHQGTIVRITSSDVTLQGFLIQNSGQNFDKEDSAVYIEGENVRILDNRMIETLFGVNAAQAHDLVVSGNAITGIDVDMGIRGDGIKVWYSHRTMILDNHITRSRDLLIWYSNDVVVRGNTIDQGRYGFHFMNSDNGIAEQNRLFDNSVGIYLMYGKGFIIRDNLLQGSRGPSGHGLGLKEIDGVEVDGNIIYDNRIGVYVDNSPLSPALTNVFRFNLIAFNDIGLGLLPSTHNNLFTQNNFVDNQQQVSVLGSGSLGDIAWSDNGIGNFWSDYAGYDADGDGIGDIAFKSEHLSEQLMSSWPILRLFRFSVAETAVDFGSRAVPMFRKEPTFTDEFPLVNPVELPNAATPAHIPDRNTARLWSAALLMLAVVGIWWGWRGSRFTGAHRRSSAPKRASIDPASDAGAPAATTGSIQ